MWVWGCLEYHGAYLGLNIALAYLNLQPSFNAGPDDLHEQGCELDDMSEKSG